jgi:Ca-activated chloride channel family protein
MRPSEALNLIVLLSISAVAQTNNPARTVSTKSIEPTFHLDSNLVLVPVTVTDMEGRIVPDLRTSDFSVTDENIPQEIISFSHEYAPVSVGILFDTSGSMQKKISKARTAVHEFLRALEQGDEVFLVTFSDRAELRTDFSSDDSAILDQLLDAQPKGSTALFDAVALAIHHMRAARNERKVLLLISDGGDNHSRLSAKELRRILEETEVQIHALGIHEGGGIIEERRGQWILEDLADMTGGEHHMVKHAGQLPELAAAMSLSLHDRYVLGYRPTPPGTSGKWRRIRVALKRGRSDRYQFYARAGYRMQ